MSSNERLCKREQRELAPILPSAAKCYAKGGASAFLFPIGYIYFGCLACLVCLFGISR